MMEIKHILVPIDFSECSRKALRYAASLASKFGSELTLLHTIEPPVGLPPQTLVRDEAGLSIPILDYVIQSATKEMNPILNELALAGLTAKSFIEVGDARDTILDHAARLNADLIVMGTHGRTGLSRFLIGSIAENVVRRSNIPVLTVRAADESRAQDASGS